MICEKVNNANLTIKTSHNLVFFFRIIVHNSIYIIVKILIFMDLKQMLNLQTKMVDWNGRMMWFNQIMKS